jgi:Na+-driven multidrug efflux pump
MSSQTTLLLLVYAIFVITDTYFLSVGINSLAAAGASIISPVLIALGGHATTVGAGGASVISRALGENNSAKASRTVANTFLIFCSAGLCISGLGVLFIFKPEWVIIAEVILIGFPCLVKSLGAGLTSLHRLSMGCWYAACAC